MSIFSLGLLKGASERVSSTFDYMQETDREKATLAEQRQYEARTRKEEREYEEGRQRVANRFALTQFDAQTQAQKDLAELQSSLRKEENDEQFWNELFMQNLQEDAARTSRRTERKTIRHESARVYKTNTKSSSRFNYRYTPAVDHGYKRGVFR